jgi:hypothetical protein
MEKIAITSFVDNEIYFADETNLMTLSGKDLDERFTFVIFAHPKILNKIKKRHNVLVYEYLPPKDIYYKDYGYAKALEFVKTNEHILNEYTHLIKTDSDVFFTTNLNSYIFDDKISFGQGGYSTTDLCVEQTYELAKMFGYPQYKRLFQAGPTLLGPTKDIIRLMALSDILCKEVFYYLCPNGKYDPTGVWGISLYGGTSVLIATEIVLSSIFNEEKMIFIPGAFDADSTSTKNLEGIYHIHCWHTDNVYSKFSARNGKYNETGLVNGDTVAEYCLDIFLKNKKENDTSIFVQIAAYRDLEVTPTILDAIQKSSGKYTINFGVHTVYTHELEINVPNLPNVKHAESKAPDNIGLGMGRALAHQFYNGEDYYLQCDSHSRFVDGWDEIAINSILKYQDMGIKKPLLTMYPANYWYKTLIDSEIGKDSLSKESCTTISFHEGPEQFKSLRIPTQTAVGLKDGNIFSKSISGGSIFTVGGFLPFNTDIAFYGEEIWLAARAYTHGYDLVIPEEQYMYHLYYDHNKPAEINKRKLLWSDFPEEFQALDLISKALIFKTLTEGTTGELLLGTDRTITEYGMFVGLDFVNGEILENC